MFLVRALPASSPVLCPAGKAKTVANKVRTRARYVLSAMLHKHMCMIQPLACLHVYVLIIPAQKLCIQVRWTQLRHPLQALERMFIYLYRVSMCLQKKATK